MKLFGGYQIDVGEHAWVITCRRCGHRMVDAGPDRDQTYQDVITGKLKFPHTSPECEGAPAPRFGMIERVRAWARRMVAK